VKFPPSGPKARASHPLRLRAPSADRASGFRGYRPSGCLYIVDDVCPGSQKSEVGTKAHSQFRAGFVTRRNEVAKEVRFAAFNGLGRTDKNQPIDNPKLDAQGRLIAGSGENPRGRYSVHFHRTGTLATKPAAIVTGCAVVDSPGWGFVNHSSHVDFQNNVAFNVFGSGFVTEAGDEVGSFRRNLAIRSKGSGEDEAGRTKLQVGSVPDGLIGKSNQQMLEQYGLKIGGAIVPAGAESDPRIHGFVADPSQYVRELRMTEYRTTRKKDVRLNVFYGGEKPQLSVAPVDLHSGWNLVSQNIDGGVRSFLVFSGESRNGYTDKTGNGPNKMGGKYP